jgi:hypothetical protein
LNGGKSKVDDESVSLATRVKKGMKFKKFSNGESTSQDGKKKKDMSKFKCYVCCKFGDYAGQCPNKKGGNETQLELVTLAKAITTPTLTHKCK